MSRRAPSEPNPGVSSVYRTVHDPGGPATLSTTVAHALADCMGIDVTDGRVSLYDSVDPTALDRLFRPRHDGAPRTGGMLSFVVDGYYVTVYADGEVVVEPPTDRY
ncbi:HalOD1 output domain-containing protein [Natronococcus wangiae]|uniref:HalOD1 output domain-containing protein n=1 Tax=Natronococcus wangiae TaxID=3068275 RepID=UPI00273ED7E1|nr:HalOD1 output domain-containing protein [Natronococcus sp. AD5]